MERYKRPSEKLCDMAPARREVCVGRCPFPPFTKYEGPPSSILPEDGQVAPLARRGLSIPSNAAVALSSRIVPFPREFPGLAQGVQADRSWQARYARPAGAGAVSGPVLHSAALSRIPSGGSM